jgi:putative oxidoreductase
MLTRFAPHAYALLRIFAGLLFATHGAQKLFSWPGPAHGPLPPHIYVAGVIELVGGLLITIGLVVPIAAFISSGLMAFAYFMGHASGGWHPVVNKGELAVLYCFLFLFMSATGSGIWSVDALRHQTNEPSREAA